jgi:siroheme synthase-like protein
MKSGKGVERMENDEEKPASGLLVALDMTGRSVLVVGAGAVASRKTARVLEAGARVHVISSAPISEKMAALRERYPGASLVIEERAFTASDLDDSAMVFAATDDIEVNSAILALARARGVLANSATVAPDGVPADFSLLARVKHRSRAALDIGVHTGGGAPALSAAFSARLARFLDDEEPAWGMMAPLLSSLRGVLGSKGDGKSRRLFWHALIQGLLEQQDLRWRSDRVICCQVISMAADTHGIELGEEELSEALELLGWY